MGKPAKAPWLAPHLTVININDSIDFYDRAFGFTAGIMMDDSDGILSHVEMSYQGRPVVLLGREGADMMANECPTTSGQTASFNIYVYCEDLEAALMQAQNAGAILLRDIDETIWGDKAALVKCINGYVFVLASNLMDEIFDEPLF